MVHQQCTMVHCWCTMVHYQSTMVHFLMGGNHGTWIIYCFCKRNSCNTLLKIPPSVFLTWKVQKIPVNSAILHTWALVWLEVNYFNNILMSGHLISFTLLRRITLFFAVGIDIMLDITMHLVNEKHVPKPWAWFSCYW